MRPDAPIQPVVARAWDFPPGHHLPPHQHEGGQFEYATSGVMTITTGRATYVVPPQRAVWIPPRTTHEVRMTGAVAMRTVYVDTEASASLPSVCSVVAVSPLLRELLSAATRIPQPCALSSPESRLFDTLLDRIRAAPAAPMELPAPRHEALRRIAAELLADPANARTLDEWARATHLGARTLARLFERETGMTFGRWRQQLRIMETLRLMSGGATVAQTASRLGYDSPSAFIAMFRRTMGATPRRYFGDRDR